jgi:hypothetical protein
VELKVAVGVPEITQVVELIVNGLGNEGEIVQFVIAAPLAANTEGATLIAAVTVPVLAEVVV